MKRVWAIVLAFLLVVGVITSVRVLATLLATIVGGEVTVVARAFFPLIHTISSSLSLVHHFRLY